MTSQFRKLNKPQVLDKLWNFFSRLIYKVKTKDVFFEYNSQLYRYTENIELRRGVYAKRNSIIGCANKTAKISIGYNTTIGFNTIIIASKGITIGDECMIAPNVYIVDSNHGVSSEENFNVQENIEKDVKIGNNVWLGAGVIVLPGVVIGNNIVVGAGSVVSRTITKPGIYYGVPATKR